MTKMDIKKRLHPTEEELAAFLDNSVSGHERQRLEEHLACCADCLVGIASAHESVELFKKGRPYKRKGNIMKKINLYLIMAIAAFAISFITPRYFLQLLVATLILGTKWIVDSKSTKMLVMIYEAWKNGGEREASRIIEKLDPSRKTRF